MNIKSKHNFFENTILASRDTLRCAAYDEPRTFEWCENNCPKYSSCDTIAWAGDELKLLDNEAWECSECSSIIDNSDELCYKCNYVNQNEIKTYKVQMYIKGTEKDARSLRKDLSLIVYDEFQVNSVFGVSVELENPPENIFDTVMSLYMVELEDGLSEKQISKLMETLPAGKKYIPIEFHENNTSAYGYIDAEYYQVHDYKPNFFADRINAILDDMNLENPEGLYLTPDGRHFYMGYFKD